MKILLVLVMVLGMAVTGYAEQKFNPMTSKWETVPDDWEVKHNPMDNDWSYQPDDAEVEYNPMEGTWDWDSGHND